MLKYFCQRWPRSSVAAVVGATLVGGYLAADAQESAASEASVVQRDAASQQSVVASETADKQMALSRETRDMQLGLARESTDRAIGLRREQFDVMRGLLQPWIDQGAAARTGQSDLAGLNGQGPQGAAIDALKNGPAFGALKRTGNEAILSNAAATGGLRGGNVQGALAQYDQSLLTALIDQQYARLTGISGTGQNAAAGVGNAAVNMGNANAGSVETGAATAGNATGAFGTAASNATGAAGAASGAAYGDIGAATAGGILGQARGTQTLVNSAINAAGVIAGSRYNYPGTPPYAPPYATGGFSGGPAFA